MHPAAPSRLQPLHTECVTDMHPPEGGFVTAPVSGCNFEIHALLFLVVVVVIGC